MKNKIIIFSALCGMLFYCNLSAQTYFSTLWGITAEGGEFNNGCIFKTDPFGDNLELRYSFPIENEGSKPYYSSLLQSSENILYGLTTYGGKGNNGVLFTFNHVSGAMISLAYFSDSTGIHPRGSLIEAFNGKLYGMTNEGGKYNMGTIFEYDPTADTLIKIHDFDGLFTGRNPNGSLLQTKDSLLYGMTTFGGTLNYGVLFTYNIQKDTLIKRIDFTGAATGIQPYGSLTQLPGGGIFGLTKGGGANNKGVLFEYDTTLKTLQIKVDFDGVSKGSNPMGSLVLTNKGKLYGMTSSGGTGSGGTLFAYDTLSESLVKKINFTGTNGYSPDGSLVIGENGKLYGQTFTGGTSYDGLVFEFDTLTGVITKKASLLRASMGAGPNTMTMISGKLYGLTISGGMSDEGTLIEYNPSSNVLTKIGDLNRAEYGRNPKGHLLYASNNKFYGMTYRGGLYNKGVLFEFDSATKVFTKKIDFSESNGASPVGGLIETTENRIFGMTSEGGDNNYGTLFEYNPKTNGISTLVHFDGTDNGMKPLGSLTEDFTGSLYGLTSEGGNDDEGVLFQYNPMTGQYIKQIDFNGIDNGSNPKGSLILGTDGVFYGTTRGGGEFNKGTIFKYYTQGNTLAKFHHFDGTYGQYPEGSLAETYSGVIAGTTYLGGTKNTGVLFYFSPSLGFINKVSDLNDSLGAYPDGSLFGSVYGGFYGMTNKGGKYNNGTLFEYLYSVSKYSIKQNFNELNGAFPTQSRLTEVCDSPQLIKAPIDIEVLPEEEGFFSLVASGTVLSYQWEADTGDGFRILLPSDSITGVTNWRLSFSKIPSYWEGYRFRCKISCLCPNVSFFTEPVSISIKEVKKESMNIGIEMFPNPVIDIVNLKFSDDDVPEKFCIVSPTGKIIREYNQVNREMQIDISNLPAGLYMIKVFNRNSFDMVKFIKQ